MSRSLLGWFTILVGVLTWIPGGPRLAAATPPPGPDRRPASFARADRALEALADDLVGLRRDIHRHPELAGHEARTAGLVAKRMKALGLEVRTGVGGHGVVAVLRGARPGTVVAMRADMDAIASPAPDPVAFRSETPGVRHMCGHDVHTTVAVGAAAGLAAIRDELPGTVVFIFQPAEENATGARAMIADGAMEHPRPRAIFALHTTPLEVGQIGTQPGLMLAGRDMVVVRIHGKGDLERAAGRVGELIAGLTTLAPEQAVQPVVGDFVTGHAFQSARDPEGCGWVVAGFVTTTSDSLRGHVRRNLEKAIAELGAEEVVCEMEYRERVTAGVWNDPALERAARDPVRGIVGDAGLVPLKGVLPAFSEDFGFFQDVAPGVMYWLGVSNSAKGTTGMPHSPDYVADEGAILLGARTMAAVMLHYLEANP